MRWGVHVSVVLWALGALRGSAAIPKVLDGRVEVTGCTLRFELMEPLLDQIVEAETVAVSRERGKTRFDVLALDKWEGVPPGDPKPLALTMTFVAGGSDRCFAVPGRVHALFIVAEDADGKRSVREVPFEPFPEPSLDFKFERLDGITVRGGVAAVGGVPLSAADVSVAVKSDGYGFTGALAVQNVTPDGNNLEITLSGGLPRSGKHELRVTLAPPASEKVVVEAAFDPAGLGLAVGDKRDDKTVKFFADIAVVSDAGKDGESRDEEGLLDLRWRPLRTLGADDGVWYRRWAPLVDLKVGTDAPEDTKAANSVVLGAELMLARSAGADGREDRLNLGFQHRSDRDFKTREAVVDCRWEHIPQRWETSSSFRQRNWKARHPGAPPPRLRSWFVRPSLGAEAGWMLAAPDDKTDGADGGALLPIDDDGGLLRLKAGIGIEMNWARFTWIITDDLRHLTRGPDEGVFKNMFTTKFQWRFAELQGIVLTVKHGRDAPTFEMVDSMALGYRITY